MIGTRGPFKLGAGRADDRLVNDQVADRCPGCASAVRPGSPWCTLCFTDLRPPAPEPEPARADVVSAPGVSRNTRGVDSSTAPLDLLERDEHGGSVGDDLRDVDEAGSPARSQAEADADSRADALMTDGPGWPCLRCGETVGLELSICPACGAGFMQGASGPGASSLGRFGNGPLDTKTQFMIMIGGAGLLCGLILVGMFVIGAVL